MNDYISRGAAICVADYAADEHPYDKNPEKPETFTEYNQGWNDACDYIRERLEIAEKADVAPVRRGEWLLKYIGYGHYWECSECHTNPCIYVTESTKFCPNCGARMDGGTGNEM